MSTFITGLTMVLIAVLLLIAGACVFDIVKEIIEWIKEIRNG